MSDFDEVGGDETICENCGCEESAHDSDGTCTGCDDCDEFVPAEDEENEWPEGD